MKQRIINFLLRNIPQVLVPEDIITQDKNGIIYLGGVVVADGEVRMLHEEAKSLKKMRIWSIINETSKQLALEKGWNKSTTMEHLNTAKTEYHVLDFQKSIVDVFANKKWHK